MNGVGTLNGSYLNYDPITMVNGDVLQGVVFTPNLDTNPAAGTANEAYTLWVNDDDGSNLYYGDRVVAGDTVATSAVVLTPTGGNPNAGEITEDYTLWYNVTAGVSINHPFVGSRDLLPQVQTLSAVVFTASSGTWTDTCDIKCWKSGEVVLLVLNSVSAAMDAAAASITCPAGTIPATFRSDVNRSLPIIITQNAVPEMGKLSIATNGSLGITLLDDTAFTTGGDPAGWGTVDVTYHSNPN